MKKTAAKLTLLALIFCSSSQAAEKTINVDRFTSVTAQQGINLTVKCASTPSMVISGSKETMSKLQVSNKDGSLLLSNEAAENDRFVSHTLDITLYTSNPLNALSGKAGVKIDAAACAVSPEQLSVSGSMGTEIRAEGKTDELQLELAMGGSFNRKSTPFSAKSATVRMSMGAEAFLCNIPKITGTLAAGARLSVSPSAGVDTGAASTFASDISTSGCA
ncbi:hypothetical protein Dpoa2040_000942 [Dickeya sp. CFBP 2040]|uniref:Putative auto-transporter adhesin head GIN domain-containing protein n=1 Tax=Dickeya poaceiphila TaxID=568768 RepID=A0A5B8IBG8_9GAMM|nr:MULTISPECIES: DUF2807 domain-containing protein [Dickeya]NKI73723.1 hypothetical protein [Dickeya sp. CFBP 2040]QDX31511.1 hypothetical protein Dpoa569_0003551 [Dickeya poaceiphila]